MNKGIRKGSVYKHYKDNNYYVYDIALHTELPEVLVVYQELDNDSLIFLRPLDMFLEEAPTGEKNITGQEYRFELNNNIYYEKKELTPKNCYKHNKGMDYELLCTAIHTETSEEFIIYRSTYGEKKLFAKPKSMFLEDVEEKRLLQVR